MQNVTRRTTEVKSVVSAMLLADFEDVDTAAVAAWTDDQRAEAFEWAMREHLSASDNDDVVRLPRPPHVRALLAHEAVRVLAPAKPVKLARVLGWSMLAAAGRCRDRHRHCGQGRGDPAGAGVDGMGVVMWSLHLADSTTIALARQQVATNHYLRKPPDVRSRPLCYVVSVASQWLGCLFFGRTESTSCFRGGLTYGSQDDVARGRARWDRWEILCLSRVWLSPDVQPGGQFHRADLLPGFVDRNGVFRSTLASTVIEAALARVGYDYLLSYPPVWVDEPFVVRCCLSYCDTRLHRGTIYRAAGFQLARTNGNGIETWWTDAVTLLTSEQDDQVRRTSAVCPRARQLRARRTSGKQLELWGDK